MNCRREFNKRTGFGQVIDGSIARIPECEALVFGDWRISYGELGALINKTAHYILSRGIKKGDKVAIISRNCPEFIIAEFALYKIGVIPVKINWRLTPAEMEYLLDANEVCFAFMRIEKPAWGEELINKYKDRLDFFVLENSDGRSSLCELIDSQPNTTIETVIDDDEPACHVHTSGTTGHPKCVIYSHGAMLNELDTVHNMYGYEEGQRYQFIAQLFHSASIGAHISLCTGGTIVLMSQFVPETYMKSLIDEKITAISVMPVVLKHVLDEMDKNHYDLSSLKIVRYSTCPIPPVLLARAMDKLNCRFFQSYGMTEMGSIVTTLQPNDHLDPESPHLNSVGLPIPGAGVKIVDSEGNDCAPSEIGEILVKGPGCMIEYLGNPELTGKAFSDGWYHTKDMGSLDKVGYLTISGRADDMIISGGENIYPNEIINVIMRLNDDILEAAAYGVPDEVWGEHVKASVVLLPNSSLTAADIKAYCRANMPSFRVPKEIEFLDSLPKNPAGKVQLKLLKNRNSSEQAS